MVRIYTDKNCGRGPSPLQLALAIQIGALMSNGKYKGEATVIFQALNAAGCLFWNLERNAELPYDESVIYVAKKLRDKARLSIEPIMVTRIYTDIYHNRGLGPFQLSLAIQLGAAISTRNYKVEADRIVKTLNAVGCSFWNSKHQMELSHGESVIHVAKKLMMKVKSL